MTAWRARWRNPEGGTQGKVFDRKIDADRHGHRTEVAKDDGTYIDARKGRVTLREYSSGYLANLIVDDVTFERIESRLRTHIWPVLGGKQMGTLARQPSAIQGWLKGLSCGPSTARLVLGDVSAVFNAAIDDGIVAKNPCRAKSVRPPEVEERKVRPFEPAIVHALRVGVPTARCKAMVPVGAGCGPRQGEIFGLHRSDIDFLGRWLYINRQVKWVRGKPVFALPKGRKTRKVPLPDWVSFELAELIREFDIEDCGIPPMGPITGPVAGLLFVDKEGLVFRRLNFNRTEWKPALRVAGLDDKDRANGMHRLRHTFASTLLAEGESIAAVAAWLGHTKRNGEPNPQVTLETYAHVMPKAEDRTRRVIDSVFGLDGVTTVSQEASDGV